MSVQLAANMISAIAGALIGHPVEGVRVALTDGAAHTVDSSELAFKLACQYAFRDAYNKAAPTVLEPIMSVEVTASLISSQENMKHSFTFYHVCWTEIHIHSGLR